MDVRMPDGTIVKGLPEGTTKAQLQAKLAGRYGFPEIAPQQAAESRGASFYDRLRSGLATGAQNIGQAAADAFTPNPYVVGAAETALQMATNFPATAIGGFKAAANAITGEPLPQGAQNTVQQAQQDYTYQPRTPYAGVAMDALNHLAAPITAAHNKAEEFLGDTGYDVGGPVLGAIGRTAPTAIESIVPFLGRRPPARLNMYDPPRLPAPDGMPTQPGRLPPPVERLPPQAPNIMESAAPGTAMPEIRAALESGQPNIHTAGYQLQPTIPYLDRGAEVAARVVREPAARRAMRLGTDPDAVVMIERADPVTRRKMGQMVNVTDNWLTSGRSQRVRAADIAGQSIMDRLNVLLGANQIAGRMVGRQVERLTGTVDLTPAINNFNNQLAQMGVRVGADGLDFAQSTVSLTPAAQTSLSNVYELLTRRTTVPARAAHNMKQAVTNRAKLGEQLEGVDAQTANAIRGIRADINEAIGADRPGYRNANRHYSDTIETLNDVNKRLGGVEDLTDADAARTAGTILRRTVSSAVSGGRVSTELGNLTDLSRQYLNGVEGFPSALLRRNTGITPAAISDDLNSLITMSAHLEKRFGSPAPTSITGVMNSAAERAADVAGVASALTSPVAAANEALNLARRKVRASDAEQLRALRDLIQRER
jgi:hypothetical protein